VRRRRSPDKADTREADQIVAQLRAGNLRRQRVEALCIGWRTYDEWLRRGASGRSEDEPFRLLREPVEETRANAETRHVALINRAAAGDWRTPAWLLEREHQGRFGAS
jgi:hypothetical protein